jgi:hypothetical protein
MIGVLLAFASSAFVPQHLERSFISWMRFHHLTFVGDDYHLRFGIYLTNFRYAQSHNAKSSFRLGMTGLAAHTPAEYSALLGSRPPRNLVTQRIIADPPDSLDWRDSSYVPPVVDAAECTSWPFAAVVPLSHLYFQAQNSKIDFSPQNLIDCVTTNDGCSAGNVQHAWEYVIKNQTGKVPSAETYPYVFPAAEDCHFNAGSGLEVIKKAVPVGLGNETDLLNSVAAYGPVVVALDASTVAFQLYSGGVFEDDIYCSSVLVNHEMVVVGYGSNGETPYWIVQNSWGTGWGEDGYIRVIRGKNLCGIATYAIHAE